MTLRPRPFQSIGRFFTGTLLSRVSGMARDLSMAFAFGDHPSVAAFMVAFRFSNLFRRLLGEGPLQTAFVPHFEGLRTQDTEQANVFFRKLTVFMAALLILIVLLGEVALTTISSFHLSEGNQEIVTLTAWMLPGLLFICLYGLNISLLHCHNIFFTPSFAPFVCNMIWVAGALLLQYQAPSKAMITLAQLVVIGFLCQWLLTLRATLRYVPMTIRDCIITKIPREVIQLAKAFGFGIIGIGATQINTCVDALFARYADLSGPVYLWYSIRLEQLVFATFGLACTTTAIPALSRFIQGNDSTSARELFSATFNRILYLMIPCTFATFAVGEHAVNLIYGRGSFSAFAVSQTTWCLWAYCLGLIPATLTVLLSALYYASHDFKTPTKISLCIIVANIILNSLFVFILELGAISTALATSLCQWANFWILYRYCQREGWVAQHSTTSIAALILVSIGAVANVVIVEHLFLSPTLLTLVSGEQAVFSTALHEQMSYFLLVALAFLAGIAAYGGRLLYRELIQPHKQTLSPISPANL